MARTGIKIPKPPPGGSLEEIIQQVLNGLKAADGAVPAVVNAADKPALTSSTKFGSALVQNVKSAEAKAEARVLAKLQKRQANVAANKALRAADQQSLSTMSDEAYDAAMAAKEAKSAANRVKAKNVAREEIDRIYTPQVQFEKGIPALGDDIDLISGRVDKATKLSDETSNEFERELLRVYQYRLDDATRRAGKELTKKQKAQIAKDASYDILTTSDRTLTTAESQLITRIQGGVTAKGKVVVGESQKPTNDLIRDAAVISRRQDRAAARKYGGKLPSAKKNVKRLAEDDPFGAEKRYQRGYRDVEYDNMIADARRFGENSIDRPKGMKLKDWRAAQKKAGDESVAAWTKIMEEDMGWTRAGDNFKKIPKAQKLNYKPDDMSDEDWKAVMAAKQKAADKKAFDKAAANRGKNNVKGQNIIEFDKKPEGMSEKEWVKYQEWQRMDRIRRADKERAAAKKRAFGIMDKQKNKTVRENTLKQYSDEELAGLRKNASDAQEKRVGQDIDWLNKNGFDTSGLSDNEIMALRTANEYRTTATKGANKGLASQKAAREKLDAQFKRGILTRKEYEDLVGQLPRKVTSSGATKIPKRPVKPVKKVANKAVVAAKAKYTKISEKELAELTESLRNSGTPYTSASLKNKLKIRTDY